jgi:molybdopterin/thiamine biosynthesis adenylyltransferase
MNSLQNLTLMMVGLGNIGSHFCASLAKSKLIPERVILIDQDRYEESNLSGQAINRSDVGKAKVDAQAAKLLRRYPGLKIDSYRWALQAVPLGVYRQVNVVFSGLDSRIARRDLNERVYRTDVPLWIDGGVSPDEDLARVTVIKPRLDGGSCLECGWSKADYAALEQRHLCGEKSTDEGPATAAPATLGQLAASAMLSSLTECLAGTDGPGAHECLFRQGEGETRLRTRLTKNPDCRFHHLRDAQPDYVQRLDLNQPLGTFFERVAPFGGDCGIRVEGAGTWVRQTACRVCNAPARRCLQLASRFSIRCGKCESAMLPVGFESRPILWRDDLSTERMSQSLWSSGMRHGDEISFFKNRTNPEPVLRLALAV